VKYSRQRDIILKMVQNSYHHPNAYMVYEEVRKEIPNISLGTVYRNLNLLSELNLIKKIIVPSGNDRYDKTLINHSHFHCDKCKKVFDINESFQKITTKIEQKLECKIISQDSVFNGICKDCLKKEG